MKITMDKAILWLSPKKRQVLGNQKLDLSGYSPVGLGRFCRMIGPCYLHGALIPKFRDHLMEFAYYPVIRHGLSNLNVGPKTLTLEEAEATVKDFTKWRFPIVCLGGSKSSVPFFDYHIALGFGESEREVTIGELLVREPVHEKCR
ncbi:hypothetical protein NYE69_07250 [Paenibacillus sp. FSL R5-0527]|uniref:hypothetical protein n=1 Tax=Paenibacillus sp. FSL R5-0527 TaxID=2975321 RepID=UPI0030F4EA72